MDKAKEKRIKLGAVNFIIVVFILMTAIVIFCIYNLVSSDATPDYVFKISNNGPAYADQNTLAETQLGRFYASDKDVIWGTSTQVNIFDHGDPHVQTDGTGKAAHLVAPGTKNDYVFSLSNEFDRDITYHLEISGANDSHLTIPVMVEVLDDKGNQLTDGKILIKDFKTILDSGTISGQHSKNYSINWEWVFENGTDDYDTFLGDTAVDEEIACHMNINVVAEFDDPTPSYPSAPSSPDDSNPTYPSYPSGPDNSTPTYPSYPEQSNPDDRPVLTGDNTGNDALIYFIIIVGSATVVLFIVITVKKKKDRHENS